MNGASDADGEAVEASEETPTPYSQMAGRTVSGKIVVLSMAAIVVAVVVAAQVWLDLLRKSSIQSTANKSAWIPAWPK